MLKKILLYSALGLAIKFVIDIYMANRFNGTRPPQAEVNKIVAENAKKTREELMREALAAERADAGLISQADLESLVIAQNKTYPKTSSDGIRVDRSTAGPKLWTIYKTMVGRTSDEFEINPSNFKSFRPALVDDACSNPGVRNILRSGISVQVVMRDMNGNLIYDFTARPKDCS